MSMFYVFNNCDVLEARNDQCMISHGNFMDLRYLWMQIYFFPCIIYIPIHIQFIWNILVGINFYNLVVDS